MAESTITVRRVPFEFPSGLDPVLIEGCPEESFVLVGLSLLLPYLEPYLIRTMRAARAHVKAPELVRDLDAFNGQEGQHYRQHARFNEAIRLSGFTGLAELETELDADYRRFTESKSLRWNLAYAEGFEAYTGALARYTFESGFLARLHPAARELMEWHLVEELEHRTVAFDVYEHVCGGYWYRLRVGWFAQKHLNRFVFRATQAMLNADPAAFRAKYGGKREARARLRPSNAQMLRGFLPKVLATYLPWYSPHRIEVPALAKSRADHYAAVSAQAASNRTTR